MLQDWSTELLYHIVDDGSHFVNFSFLDQTFAKEERLQGSEPGNGNILSASSREVISNVKYTKTPEIKRDPVKCANSPGLEAAGDQQKTEQFLQESCPESPAGR